jgi:YHS domain-containing protein
MLRWVLIGILIVFVARAFWRIIDGIVEGARGGSANVPGRSVPMVRDPVCGTFVVRERALTLTDGREQVYFCSAACRDSYRARTA